MITFPGFQIVNQIYNSANSVVYRGRRLKDNLPVILKILKDNYPTPASLVRYKQEYEIIRCLNIPGVVKAYSLEKYHNTLAIVFEDFGGESFKKLSEERKLTLSEFLAIAIQITDSLSQIHAANIIHKDINPSNIIFNPETGEVKIIDFGISTVLTRENPIVKNPNVLEGTLAYMSPEQTGRMNRSLDYRTDFYSLGATFYELLTHQGLFDSTDAMELVHCHIAMQPVPPYQINPEIPKPLSDIVMKCSAKTAEDRYQSAWGIQVDLVICQMQLEANGEIEDLIPGENDISDKFHISQKLYGREREIETLLAATERVSNGGIEMMLVSGYSGIGKTSLVQEIYKPITKQQGYFISGKFSQFQRNIPYSGLIQAFQELVGQLLSESEDKLQLWREKLLAALGQQGKVIIDVIPEMELIVGKQPEVVALPGAESQNRFNIVFQKFIRVFSQLHHPFAIFLDDLQWADSATLKLIELIMTDPDTHSLFLIGAYRDNEISSAYPLMLKINEIEQAGAVVNQIFLSPLELPAVKELISDTLKCDRERTKVLAELVLAKTHGNPFFMTEFLKALYADKLFNFDLESLSWQWSIEEITAQSITDNVVELMVSKIQKLSDKTQQVLKLAACIGNQFDLETLAIVCEKSLQETAADLWEAIAEGLALPARRNAYNATGDWLALATGTCQGAIAYKFAHNRIQQAACILIPDAQRQAVHRQVGLFWLQNTPPDKREQKIFDIVNQLNSSSALINSQSEQDELAELNLMACQKAKASAAHQLAFNYSNVGVELLGEDSWERQYELTLAVYESASEAAYLSGNFQEMERLTSTVLQHSNTLLDKVKVCEIKIQAYTVQNKPAEAVKTALQVLKLLDVGLLEVPAIADIQLGMKETKSLFTGVEPSDLIDLPEMTDAVKLAAMRILSRVSPAAYRAFPGLFPLIVFKQVNLSVTSGNTPVSTFAYALYGLILCGVLGDIKSGFQFGEVALKLLDKLNARELRARTLALVNQSIRPWKEHVRDTLKSLRECYQSALETGDLEYAAWSASIYCYHSFFLGAELEGLEREMATYTAVMRQIKQETAVNHNELYHQAVLNLIGRAENPCKLIGEAYDEGIMLPQHLEGSDRNAILYLYLCKLILCYLFQYFSEAVENSVIAEKYLDSVPSMLCVPLFHLYESLALLAVYADAPKSEQKCILLKVKANQKKMQKWSHNAPMNFLHKFYLVGAELNRVQGIDAKARDLYDRAIESAKESEYLSEEALGNELAAKFYLAKGKIGIARVYMQEARYCYVKWGATAKVKDLDTRYPQLVSRKNDVNYPVNSYTEVATLSTNDSRKTLDLTAVMKASQVISGEIVLDKLLEKLMNILIQNAGAQKGCLIVASEGKLLISAEASVDREAIAVQQYTPVYAARDLPLTAIKYVERTCLDIVLSDAARDGQFSNDPYIAQRQVKSLLCTPIVDRGKLIGILYLENNLTVGAFTPQRLEVLRLLSSQAAISLENALLYANLEEKVLHRTQELNEKNLRLEQTLRELQRTQTQLIQTEKMSSLGQLVAGIAHEINNPIGFIYGNIEYANNYMGSLLNLIYIYQQEFPHPTAIVQKATEDIELDFMVEDLKRLLTSMKGGAERIRNIVLSLRNFSRLDESDMKPVDLHEGIDSTLVLLQSRLREVGIEVIKEYSQLPKVTCYASELNQVFMNILSNAIDALEAEGRRQEKNSLILNPQIQIRTEVTDTNTVTIRMADNGPGINLDVQKKIFDPFFSTKPVGSGTGLGLSISYQIVVDKHGGQFSCISAPGQGASFAIAIPIKPKN